MITYYVNSTQSSLAKTNEEGSKYPDTSCKQHTGIFFRPLEINTPLKIEIVQAGDHVQFQNNAPLIPALFLASEN